MALAAETDRVVIEALGVFVGGFTREAAEVVAGADLGTLSRLSQLALIQRLPDPYGGSRYQMHELIRNYALARLEFTDHLAGSIAHDDREWRESVAACTRALDLHRRARLLAISA